MFGVISRIVPSRQPGQQPGPWQLNETWFETVEEAQALADATPPDYEAYVIVVPVVYHKDALIEVPAY